MAVDFTSELRSLICTELDNMPEVCKTEDECYCYEIHAAYIDGMDNKTATEISQSDDPITEFLEKLQDWWNDYEWGLQDDLEERVKNKLIAGDGPYPDGFTDMQGDMFTNMMRELVYFQLPEDHYLDQRFCVNVMVDTGDGSYDYTLNSVYPCWYGNYEDEIDDKASIVWLARQQGYSKEQLWDALKEGDIKDPHGFLETMRQEVANCGSGMMVLTFLVEVSLRDLIELNRLIKLQDRNGHFYDNTKNPGCGYVVIDKNTMTGLYSPWDGCGGVLEIELDKDVRLPIRFIRSALPDGGDGRSISRAFCIGESAWSQGGVKQIYCPEELNYGY